MIAVTNVSHRAKRLPLARGGFLILAPGKTDVADIRIPASLDAWEAAGIVLDGGDPVKIKSNHEADLTIPVAGVKLRRGALVEVKRWHIVKQHPTVKAWLGAKIIEEVHDVVLGPGDEGSRQHSPVEDIGELRAQYQELFSKRPFMGWGAGDLREKIDNKLAE